MFKLNSYQFGKYNESRPNKKKKLVERFEYDDVQRKIVNQSVFAVHKATFVLSVVSDNTELKRYETCTWKIYFHIVMEKNEVKSKIHLQHSTLATNIGVRCC